jgi:hypothetical protein
MEDPDLRNRVDGLDRCSESSRELDEAIGLESGANRGTRQRGPL